MIQIKHVLRCTKCHSVDEPNLMKYSFHPKRNVQYYMCRECNRKRMNTYYHQGGSTLINKLNKAHCEKDNWVKQKARAAVNYAVKTGKLIRPKSCSVCGNEVKRIEGHHEDYSKKLEVVWVCTPCHKQIDMKPSTHGII